MEVVSRCPAPDDHCARAASRSNGRVSLYNRGHYVGRLHQGKDVCVLYDPESNEWVFADREGRQLSRRSADQLSPDRVMNLNVTNRR